jgi:hypothetical protein
LQQPDGPAPDRLGPNEKHPAGIGRVFLVTRRATSGKNRIFSPSSRHASPFIWSWRKSARHKTDRPSSAAHARYSSVRRCWHRHRRPRADR